MRRVHALDALRAAMMLLGIVLHTAANYTVTPLKDAWPYQDAHRLPLFDLTLFLIHIFRMPVFFVMAGFFASLVYERLGAGGFMLHRTRRLLLPLVIAWPIIYPMTRAGFVFALAGGGSTGVAAAAAAIQREPYAGASLVHLWFIWHLFLLCGVAAIVKPALDLLPRPARLRVMDVFARRVPTWSGCLTLGFITTLTLIPMDAPQLDTSVTPIPALRVLIAYAVFFAFGWLLHHRQDLLGTFARTPGRFMAAGLGLCAVHIAFIIREGRLDTPLMHWAGVVTAGPATWLLAYGIIGTCIRRVPAQRPLQRYLSDASYWMYILHLPVVIALAGVLSPLPAPALLKFTIVLAGTIAITLGSYHAIVRSTAIGVLLNGRRQPRALPAAESP